MKYLEELGPGDCFSYKEKFYLLTSDYKKNGHRLCYDLKGGNPLWLASQDTVEDTQIYTLDANNNIIAIKPTSKSDAKI